MRRLLVSPIISVFLALSISGSGAAEYRSKMFPTTYNDAEFIALAANADRPLNGRSLYKNLHKYMWREVYMMATRDTFFLPGEENPLKDENGEFVFIRTWRSMDVPSLDGWDTPFNSAEDSILTMNQHWVYSDAILYVPTGVDLDYWDFEFVGVVCGSQTWNFQNPFPSTYALPIICVPSDGITRIRAWPHISSHPE